MAAIRKTCFPVLLLVSLVCAGRVAAQSNQQRGEEPGASVTKGRPAEFRIKLETVLKHDDGKFLWFHPRTVAMPGLGESGQPAVLMTLQKHLRASDHYSGLSVMRSDDLGRNWSEPDARPELDWVREPGGVDIAVADVTPGWHPQTMKVIAVGAQVRYSARGEQLEDQPRSHQTAYAVFDPKTGNWTGWRRLEMPASPEFNFARSACAQFVVEPGGTVLLPFYVGTSASEPYATTVVRFTFDGNELAYREHGDLLRLDVARGLYEPSLVRARDRYFLTIRNDEKGYVTASSDGLNYQPIKPWKFDDGQDLGSYNTQQHWLAHGDDLFLVYTRRGANNDHIMRHRAPLFIAQVDPQQLHVVRETEQVLVPERGATLGNFGAAAISDSESWVTVAEGVWNDEARSRGADGSLFLARVIWSGAKSETTLQNVNSRLRAAQPTRIVCFGDSVTGVYYHTGGRRAYTDMLGIALKQAFPNAELTMINAGISGNTTRDGLQRIQRDVLRHEPALVTVMFGLNDMTRVPLEEYRQNLREIVTRCRSAGAEVLLCTPNNVISTAGRPTEKLIQYCDAVREVARAMDVPLCDCYHRLQALRDADARAWRLLMSDEIHPNMDGHKRIAEAMAESITGQPVSLKQVPPPSPALARTVSKLKNKMPVKILAMTPLDRWIELALKQLAPDATLEITPWPTAGKTLQQLEQDAKQRVRAQKPDLVVIAIPRSAAAGSREQFIHDYAWIMNWSLSFGTQEWDCFVIHPSVTDPQGADPQYDTLVRQLVRAQDLSLIERVDDDAAEPQEIVKRWLKLEWNQ